MIKRVEQLLQRLWDSKASRRLRRSETLRSLWDGKVCALPFFTTILIIISFLSIITATNSWNIVFRDEKGAVKGGHVVFQICPIGGGTSGCLLAGSKSLNDKFKKSLEDDLTPEDWKSAVTASGLATWRLMSALALVASLCALFLAGFVIWHAPSYPKGWQWGLERLGIVVLLLSSCVLIFVLVDTTFFTAKPDETLSMKSTIVVRQFLGYVESHLNGRYLVYYELKLLSLGYAAALLLLCASGATLLPYRRPYKVSEAQSAEEAEAEGSYMAMQMRHLRIVLYMGAVMLALTALRGKTNFDWALDYLPPLWVLPKDSPELQNVTAFYGRLRTLALGNVTAVSVLNTLVLAVLYIPAALILQKRADELSERATGLDKSEAEGKGTSAEKGEEKDDSKSEGKKKPAPEEWLRERGLAFPLKEQLTRIAAILAPLLAGPISELLTFLK